MELFKRKKFGSGMSILILSNEEINDIAKMIKSLEEAGLLIKGLCETIENEVKERKGGLLGILLGTLADSLWGHLLTGRGLKQSNIHRPVVIRGGENRIQYFSVFFLSVFLM